MTKRTAALLFVSIFGLYLAMSPNTTVGRGYVGEEINSGIKMIKMFDAWVKGRPIPPMEWTRHGPIPVLFDIPFIRLGGEIVSSDYMMSMSPILFTSAMLWILFLWLRKLTSPAMSLLLTVGAGFGTLLWPYAYIGLETKMSFFVLLAGYLGIANGRIRAWPKLASIRHRLRSGDDSQVHGCCHGPCFCLPGLSAVPRRVEISPGTDHCYRGNHRRHPDDWGSYDASVLGSFRGRLLASAWLAD
jgi:hypothetical protein